MGHSRRRRQTSGVWTQTETTATSCRRARKIRIYDRETYVAGFAKIPPLRATTIRLAPEKKSINVTVERKYKIRVEKKKTRIDNIIYRVQRTSLYSSLRKSRLISLCGSDHVSTKIKMLNTHRYVLIGNEMFNARTVDEYHRCWSAPRRCSRRYYSRTCTIAHQFGVTYAHDSTGRPPPPPSPPSATAMTGAGTPSARNRYIVRPQSPAVNVALAPTTT